MQEVREKEAQASTPATLLLREGQSSALSHLSYWNSFEDRLCGSQDGTSLQVSSKWGTWGAKEATAQAEDSWDMLPDLGAPQQPQAEQWLWKLVFLPLTERAPAPITVIRQLFSFCSFSHNLVHPLHGFHLLSFCSASASSSPLCVPLASGHF